jgi:hypothetical protein
MKINKNILLLIIVLLFISFIVFLAYGFIKSPSLITNNDPEPELSLGQITRNDVIKHIEWAYRNNKPYQQFSLEKDGSKNYVVTFYQPNFRDENVKKEELNGGTIVFKITNNKPAVFWEISSSVDLTRPVIETRDINNDGYVEITADWSDGTIDNLFIYSWTGESFKFISPTTTMTSPETGMTAIGYRFVVRLGDIQVKDLDGDNIDEVIISGGTTRDEIGNEIPVESETIYKWNTDKKEYYLWKEEKIGEGK